MLAVSRCVRGGDRQLKTVCKFPEPEVAKMSAQNHCRPGEEIRDTAAMCKWTLSKNNTPHIRCVTAPLSKFALH